MFFSPYFSRYKKNKNKVQIKYNELDKLINIHKGVENDDRT